MGGLLGRVIDAAGRPLAMPTGHDDFSERAHRDAADVPADARAHRDLLRAAMEAEGFTGISSEWWHYDAPGWDFAGLLFASVWTLDPGHIGFRLSRRLGERDWQDLLDLMANYRSLHQAAQTTGQVLWP